MRLALLSLLVASCGDGNSDPPKPTPIDWTAEFSHGCVVRDDIVFIPSSDGCHYITKPSGALTAASEIRLHYRVEMGPGIEIKPSSDPSFLSVGPTIYFQVCHDDMRTDGNRWWATFASPMPIVAGDFSIVAPMKAKWTSVIKMNSLDNAANFQSARANVCRIGFTLGGGTGYGHGVFATGPAKIIITSFTVE